MSGEIQSRRAQVGGPLSRQLYPKSPDPMPAIPASLEELTDSLYNHVLETIDFGAIHRFEQLLWSLLPELGIHDEEGEVAAKMIKDAIVKAASDPMRNVSTVPYGVTEEEEKAVKFDDGCFFCVYEDNNPREENRYVDGECACCDMMAREWRKQHAAVLDKRGVRPPAHRGPPSS